MRPCARPGFDRRPELRTVGGGDAEPDRCAAGAEGLARGEDHRDHRVLALLTELIFEGVGHMALHTSECTPHRFRDGGGRVSYAAIRVGACLCWRRLACSAAREFVEPPLRLLDPPLPFGGVGFLGLLLTAQFRLDPPRVLGVCSLDALLERPEVVLDFLVRGS